MRQALVQKQTSVTRIREEIDLTDRMIVMLLGHRQELVLEVGRWKKKHHKPIPDSGREKKILNALLMLTPTLTKHS